MVIKNKELGIDIALEGLSWEVAIGNDIKITDTYDFQLIDDLAVVRQAIIKRLNTPKGKLWAHPDYGCEIWDLLSEPMTDTWFMEAITAIHTCINDDPRAKVVDATYEAVLQERQVAFSITYVINDGRQGNLVWTYSSEAVMQSV
ncbi:GPW/gp25 family protein [Pelosinus sp. IPA-1]|uniref:GPW/gp25 family protein n=1 Tax=Pelosinus sp. IPA-1 TaxID=3029569 RepID=UPI00243620AD|nr:GPW/gp25 family protein [Pelosinus sp. IPA-1]GMB00226.1 hypothetical protein PIPA1_30250 [Pelosinus sp. IPA-1]